jgi:hypothetical protein
LPATYALTNLRVNPNLKVEDDDVHLLADYYYRTRALAEEDMRQFQQQSPDPGQVQGQPQVDLQLGPTATKLRAEKERDEISSLGERLAGKSKAVASLGELIYASLPGYCLRENKMPPPSYFNCDQGSGALQYVGPVPLAANRLVLANPYLVIINRRVSAARASAAWQAEWIRHVVLWHENHPSITSHAGSGGAGPASGGVVRAPVHPPANPVPAGSGTAPGSRQRQAPVPSQGNAASADEQQKR